MKRKIAIRATVGVMVCGLMLGGCSEWLTDEVVVETVTGTEIVSKVEEDIVTEPAPETETEVETEIVTEVESETETEEEVEDPYFGLSVNEVEYLIELARSKNLPCMGLEDISDIKCIGYYRKPMGGKDYTQIEYGLLVKNGPAVCICIPVELLEEWGIDVEERGGTVNG